MPARYHFLSRYRLAQGRLLRQTRSVHLQKRRQKLRINLLRTASIRLFDQARDMDHERRADDASAFLVRAALLALTLTSAVSAYKAATAGDLVSSAFVVTSYSTLLLLFRRLRAYERLPPGEEEEAGGRRARLRREVWALCTLLTVMFAWKVAAVMMLSWPAAAAAVWGMAALTTAGGYVALFRAP